MERIFFGFMIVFGFLSTAKSQHCGWCNSSIIIVEVRDSVTGQIINDLEIILTDIMGNPYTSEWNLTNNTNQETSFSQKTDTLKFGQNPNHFFKPGSSPYPYRIPFGIEYYMLRVYYNNYPDFNKNGTDRIYIKDTKGFYESKSVTFNQQNITYMCTKNGIWDNEQEVDKVKIEVKLNRRK